MSDREKPTTFIDKDPRPTHTASCPRCSADKVRAVVKDGGTEYACAQGHTWLLKGKV